MPKVKGEKQKRRILHITDALGVGGTERVLVGVINELTDFEHHLMILGGEETLLIEIRPDVHYVNLQRAGMPGAFSMWWKVRKYILANDIDLVHSHLFAPSLLARLATPSHVTLVNSLHNIPSLDIYKDRKWILWIDRLTYRKRHRIIAVSDAVLRDFDKHVKRTGCAYVLYNFIGEEFGRRQEKTDRLDGDHGDCAKFKLVSVGNLRPPKNYVFVLEAFKHMPPGISLDIYGEGELRKELQAAIDRHNLPVRLCGSRDNMEKILPQYDAFLMSSIYEGFGIALLEAMAVGLPAVLSNIQVFREVTAGNALFFDLENPSNLVDTVTKLLGSRELFEGISKGGMERARQVCGKRRYMETLREIYNTNFQ